MNLLDSLKIEAPSAKEEESCGVEVLMQETRNQKFVDYVLGECDKNCASLAVDFVGFINTYQHLAKIIPQRYHIYDIGCAWGFQHVFFRHHASYTGVECPPKPIDVCPEQVNPIAFYPNARFVLEEFTQSYTSGNLEIKEPAFGISNLAIGYGPCQEEAEAIFNKAFVCKYFIRYI